MSEYRPVPSPETAPELAELPEPLEELPELLELTAAQQGVRYGQLVDPDSAKYNIGECLEIRGGLDEELFAAVVDRVVHHCDSLNAVLVERDGAVRQRVVRPEGVRERLATPRVRSRVWV
ncbi:condensation domain-containing protein [Kitasatospora cineracea]